MKIAEQFVFCLVEVSLRQPHGQRRQVKMQASKKWRESQLLTFPSSIVFLLFPITGYAELDRRQLCLELLYLNIFLSSRHHVSSQLQESLTQGLRKENNTSNMNARKCEKYQMRWLFFGEKRRYTAKTKGKVNRVVATIIYGENKTSNCHLARP